MGKPIIIAGGGIVTNELGELLMIFRRGKWDLPKGKLDKGESIEDLYGYEWAQVIRQKQSDSHKNKIL